MNPKPQEFDPQQILLEHKQFFEANRDAFSPLPKRFLSPHESAERSFKGQSVDYKEFENINIEPTLNNNNINSQGVDTQEKDKELLIMTIEIGNGNRDTLRIFEDDDPYDLARRFCEAHGLSEQIIEPLAQNIYANIEKVLEERAQGEGGGDNIEDVEEQGTLVKAYQEQETVRKRQQLEQYQHPAHRELDVFKDVGVKTGEFRVFNDHHQLSQHQSIPPSFQNEQSYGWEGAGASYSNHEFGIRPSVEAKGSLSQQQYEFHNTEHSTQNDENNSMQKKLLTKSTEASQRLSFIDYHAAPSDNRYLNNVSHLPENFHNDEEYLEYIINHQYGVMRGNSLKGGRNHELTFTPKINRNSRAILETKYQNNNVSVYDRLHNHAKIRNQKLYSNNNNNKKSPRRSVGAPTRRKSVNDPNASLISMRNNNDNDINYGILLYHRGVKRKEELTKARNDAKKERTFQEERECTFKPDINPISAEIVNSKPKMDRTEDSLINYGRAVREKTERARSVQKEREVEGCTFKPVINPKSLRIVHHKENMTHDPIKDRFTKLYCDSKVRQAQMEIRQSVYQENCTFTPAINDYSLSIIDNTNLDQRNKRFSGKSNKLEVLRRQKEESELFDPKTGQPLFRPQVGRPPREGSRERREKQTPIGEHLYNRRFEKENIQRDLYEREQRSIDAGMVRSSEKSQMIMENIQKKKLGEIFALFDSDEDGEISSNKIDISTVGTDILEAFAPLLCEMEELNHMLSFSEFMEAAERLLKSLPVHERDKLLLQKKTPSRNSSQDELRFHPEINRRSAKIAQQMRPYGDFDAVYEQYIGEHRANEERIRHEQNRKLAKEMKECSFRPMLVVEANMPLFPVNSQNYYYVDRLV